MVQCKACKCFYSDLDWQISRSADVSPSKKAKRLLPSSKFRLKYLSPKSAAKRKRATQLERSSNIAKLTKYTDMDLTLEDDQSDKLEEVIRTIEENVPEELDAVFREASDCSVSVGKTIRDAWENDKQNHEAEFYRDQLCNLQ